MWRLSNRYTGPLGIFTLTSRRCLAAGRRGSTAVIISRPCWYSPGSGATLRTCRRRFRGQPEGCAELEAAIYRYLDVTNEDPKPFVWTQTADQILANVARFCQRTLDTGH